MKASRKPKRVHTAFTRPGGHLFGKAAISPCPFSYWATSEAQQDPDLFYAIAKVRASELKGRTKESYSRVDGLG